MANCYAPMNVKVFVVLVIAPELFDLWHLPETFFQSCGAITTSEEMDEYNNNYVTRFCKKTNIFETNIFGKMR